MATTGKQVLVVGLGNFGLAVATELTRLGHEVMAVDIDPEAVEEAAPVTTQALELDATDEGALRALGVTEFDVAVVAINDAARAILATYILQELGVSRIVARAHTPTEVRILERAGNVRAVLVEQAMGRHVARSIGIEMAVDAMPISDDIVIVRVRVPAEGAGRTVGDIEIHHKSVVVLAIVRGPTVTVSPGGDATVASGDELVLVGRQADLEALRLAAR